MNLKEKAEWEILGGLRFALASIVFCTHIGVFVHLPTPLSHIADAGAFAAVLGFFLVSGYSIAASLNHERKHFYERRLSRIYPLYFVALVLSCLPFLVWGPVIPMSSASDMEAPKSVWPVIGNFFFLGGIAVPTLQTNPVVWSLAIEVIYYLFAPLFYQFKTRILIGIVAVSCLAYWLHNSFSVPMFNTDLHGLYGAGALLWAWMFGFLLHRCPGNKILFSSCLTAGCILLGRFDQYGAGHFSCAVFVISTLLVSFAREFSLPKRLALSMKYLGELSYPLYILHWPVMVLLAGGNSERSFWLYLFLPLAVSVFLLHTVDLPYRAYARRRLANRRVPDHVSQETLKSIL